MFLFCFFHKCNDFFLSFPRMKNHFFVCVLVGNSVMVQYYFVYVICFSLKKNPWPKVIWRHCDEAALACLLLCSALPFTGKKCLQLDR